LTGSTALISISNVPGYQLFSGSNGLGEATGVFRCATGVH
jgi:hypothetical protein